MKTAHLYRFLLPALSLLLVDCSSTEATPTAKPAAKLTASEATDSLDDYAVVEASDPLEGLNRATFKLNDGIYNYLFRPVAKGYELVTPKPMRQGIDNVYENAKFPVRFVNSGLQGKFKRAGQEAQKFGVNTFAGFGGLIKQSDRIPSLAEVPAEDTAQTLAKWRIGKGPYLVLPVLGPSTVRDAVGLAGDYALNPVNWGFALRGDADDFAWIPSTGNTVRQLPTQLSKYDEAKANSVDPYLSVRSTYFQNRKAVEED